MSAGILQILRIRVQSFLNPSGIRKIGALFLFSSSLHLCVKILLSALTYPFPSRRALTAVYSSALKDQSPAAALLCTCESLVAPEMTELTCG
jgi:hypothetical protein